MEGEGGKIGGRVGDGRQIGGVMGEAMGKRQIVGKGGRMAL